MLPDKLTDPLDKIIDKYNITQADVTELFRIIDTIVIYKLRGILP